MKCTWLVSNCLCSIIVYLLWFENCIHKSTIMIQLTCCRMLVNGVCLEIFFLTITLTDTWIPISTVGNLRPWNDKWGKVEYFVALTEKVHVLICRDGHSSFHLQLRYCEFDTHEYNVVYQWDNLLADSLLLYVFHWYHSYWVVIESYTLR